MLKRVRRRTGITLLEIMIAMSLMSVVIIAFATVFPSGYRLNFANLNQSKAARFASGLAEQLGNLSVGVLEGYEGNVSVTGMTDMQTKGYIALPQGLQLGATTATNVFWLDKIVVTPKDASNPFGASDPNPDVTNLVYPQLKCEEVTVTVKWNETRRKAPSIVKTVSVTTLVNDVIAR